MDGTLLYYSDILCNHLGLHGEVGKIPNPAQACTGTSVPVCNLKQSCFEQTTLTEPLVLVPVLAYTCELG